MSLFRTASMFVALLVITTSADAHPFHASTTEIEWNAETQRFEVAMRLRIADLEDAISARIKSRFRLESDSKRDKHLQAYLQETCSITFEQHRACRLHWMGCELELHDVWVYFEAESVAPTGADANVKDLASQKIESWDGLFRDTSTASLGQGVRIRNTVLLEIQPEQVNLVSLRMGRRRVTTSFHQQKPDGEILQP